jgi:hypothetical protein
MTSLGPDQILALATIAPEINAIITLSGSVLYDASGYVDVSSLTDALGTTLQSYMKEEHNVEFVTYLGKKLGKTMEELIGAGHGGAHPRPPAGMCHPRVALDIARWKKPEMAIEMSEVLYQYLRGEIRTEHSLAAHQVIS